MLSQTLWPLFGQTFAIMVQKKNTISETYTERPRGRNYEHQDLESACNVIFAVIVSRDYLWRADIFKQEEDEGDVGHMRSVWWISKYASSNIM